MKLFSAICAAALLTAAVHAAETAGDFAKAQAELKARAPEDYAKIEKLAATDLNAAMREFRAAAKKHDIKLPRLQLQRNRRPAIDGERPERGGERPERGGRQGRGGRFGRGGATPFAQLAADAKIRKEFPQEFDAVNAELCAAEEKLRKLAERAGVNYPQNFSTAIRKLRVSDPGRMAEIERMADDDPRGAFRALGELAAERNVELGFSAMRGRRGGGGGGRPGEEMEKPAPRRLNNPPLRKLRETFPEEMKKYNELRQEDPAAAKKLLLELTEKLNKGKSEK